MKPSSTLFPRWARAMPLLVLLAACGGGDNDDVAAAPAPAPAPMAPADPLVAGTDVPLSATASSAGAFAFVKRVVESNGDTADPLVIGSAVLGTSDTEDPQPI
jgi:hypothetical protein